MAAAIEQVPSSKEDAAIEHASVSQVEELSIDDLAKPEDIMIITTENPYGEINFIGTYCAIALSLMGAYGGWTMPATSLSYINADLGPTQDINWVALVWTLCTGIGFTLVGRLSDIFGRRYFFIASAVLATVGCIVASRAQSVNQLIGANVLIGLAAAAQSSFNYVVSELVPVRHRFYALFGVYLLGIPILAFGPIWSRLFIVHTAQSWRWDYYMMTILNFVNVLLWTIFYHPPDFEHLHRNRSKLQELKEIDYVGIFLFTAGMLLFIMGLSWGVVQYPWKSAHVLSTLVIGAVLVIAFVLYEIYMPLRRPIVPMHLFRNKDYSALIVVTTVGGMMYFSISAIYPQMVAVLFTNDIVYGGILSCTVTAGTIAGQLIGTATAVVGGRMKWKLVASCVAMTAFNGGVAGAGEDKAIATALSCLGACMVGILEGYACGLVTIVIDDQKELGAAGGIFGSVRTIGAVVSTAIFTSILNNKLSGHISGDVVPTIVQAGLPVSSVESFVGALTAGNAAAMSKIPGVTPSIIATAATALKDAYSKSFAMVFLASIAFGGCAIIAALFVPNVDDKMTHEVVRRLEASGLGKFGGKKEKNATSVTETKA
ncbi:hypothetical protein AYO21_01776 [Fonsecaea monophora]|uniref:Major facilitator superfamily (MFS) profile domain-containing protein n=1 Tax=Fonsecaea monophora TaxID=254056 RepID=A0A177FI37_9EURO|nr:hypothetical protein AYO21_01776 [Fonsecaea monophora]KAH0831572.1 siderophore iron transporter [Fonsecaea pedrosoi]OAG43924.1 hypothetical protein AYO21_01776 [Fonsecaea monophora]